MDEELKQDGRQERQETPNRIERKTLPEGNSVNNEEIDTNKPATWVACVLITTSLFLDSLSLVPGLNDVVDMLADAIFIPAFFFIGKGFNARKLSSFGAMTILEAIPFLSALPWITVNVVYCLYYSDEK